MADSKCPSVTDEELRRLAVFAAAEHNVRTAHISKLFPEQIIVRLEKAIILIDIHRTARAAGDEGAEAYLQRARSVLLDLLGIEP